MYWKDAFINTLREDPVEAELVSHKLMIRSGMIQKLASGVYSYLPLCMRVIQKIETIIRKELEKRGASELLMPAVIPAELWKESGRWQYYGAELLRLQDRKNNDFCIGPTHEEVIVDVVRKAIQSYRSLPLNLYQIQNKFRDEIRPRFGLMRGREFVMKDAYSFHLGDECLDKTYWSMFEAYNKIFSQCGLEFRPVEADSGNIGGDITHEFQVLAESSEDTIVYCDQCDYASNIERGEKKLTEALDVIPEDTPTMEVVDTPDKKSIEEVAQFLNVPTEKTIKMLIYLVKRDEEEEEFLISVSIRGDLDVNEVKLRKHLKADSVEIPDESLLKEKGLAVGYMGLPGFENEAVRMNLADHSVAPLFDAVAGANEEGKHVAHVTPTRDMKVDEYIDASFVSEGDVCPRCENGNLLLRKGIEVGQVFKLGNKYSKSMNLEVLNQNGKPEVPVMGCYGIGVTRTVASAIEQNHDEDGIVWPYAIAPYAVHVLCLDAKKEEVMAATTGLHDALIDAGIDVLVDDRKERPGIKFKDADLIGCPLRVTIGGKGIKNGIIEMKFRKSGEMVEVPKDEIVSKVIEACNELKAAE